MGSFTRIFRHFAPLGIVLATRADLLRAAPDLSEALKDTDSNVRNQAAISLAWVDPGDNRAVPLLSRWCATQAHVSPTRRDGADLELRRRRSSEGSMRH